MVSPHHTDILIIGAGTAGVVAAVQAAKSGARVSVVTQGDGATALCSGAFDICHDPHGIPGDIWKWERKWQTNIQNAVHASREHPYCFSTSVQVRDIFQTFINDLREVEFELKISREDNLLLPTPIGTWKETAGGQETQIGSDLFELEGKHVVIASISNHKNFLSLLLSQQLRALFEPQKKEVTFSVETIDLGIGPNWPDFAIAKYLEEPKSFEPLLSQLGSIVRKEKPDIIFFPPLLGVEKAKELQTKLSEKLQVLVVETLGYYESVPGIRFQRALRRLLLHHGVSIIQGRVNRAESERGRIENVFVSVSDGELSIFPSEIVLASGKWIGGGISQTQGFPIRETIFQLPLFVDSAAVEDEVPWRLVEKSFQENHKVFRIGVKVNSLFQPLGSSGEVIFDNLRASGSILTGYDPHREGCGSGVAAVTGFIAANYGTHQ
ncbi:MAG TPA: anaerobic glycerol-3-phosphate dehydrogenase subunit GlpB [Bdellovibrionota bacterium]|nr:anaerobic glycerol-3-phosphate dehydrogenase subunit GlpB [Bdellovibrionota bacterium]